MAERPKLIAVVGATGTGKSEIAVVLAEAFGGEVVSADAYQVYRGLDIGTAKAGPELLSRARHHLIDVVEPSEAMTLGRYVDLAGVALGDIWARGKLPVLAGGSGQYVWAILEGWQVPRVLPDPDLRAELEAIAAQRGVEALVSRLASLDPEAATRIDRANPRRVIRAIEVVSSTGRPLAACQTRTPPNIEMLVVGIDRPREELHRRLDARTDAMYEAGLVAEVSGLREQGFGETAAVRGGVGYKEVSAYLDGAYDLQSTITRHKASNRRLVRRQNAWFKPGDERICWLGGEAELSESALEVAKGWLQA